MAGLSLSQQSGHPTDLAAAVLTDGNRVLIVVIAVVALAALVLAGSWCARYSRPARAPTA